MMKNNSIIPVLVFAALAFLLYQERETVMDNFFNPEYGPGVIELGTGTGFFVNDRYLVTNEHVVKNCKSLKIEQPKDQKAKLTVAVIDSYNDLAILESDKPPHNVAVFRGADAIKEKDPVTIIGYPGGNYTVKQASIVYPEQEIEMGPPEYDHKFTAKKIIFTDSVRKGNSGGPLLDEYGSVIGVIDSYIETEETSYYEKDNQRFITNKENQMYGAAISLERLKEFLDRNHITYYIDQRTHGYLPPEQLKTYADTFTVKIRCVR